MPGLFGNVDPEGMLEYSVVYSDRALNHMSASFQKIMKDIDTNLKQVYNAAGVAVIPGGGSFAMEAVARQFAADKKVLVLRNGWFSFRWTQIFEAASLVKEETVMTARMVEDDTQAPFEPAPIEEVVAWIAKEKPDLVFAPHVETSAGMILPDDYIKKVAQAVHEVGGMFVLDCIASGAVWVDMEKLGVDVLISAPQKGWSAHPCAGLVMLSPLALERLQTTKSSSFSCDLKKWYEIMGAYLGGGHAYHATMPTEGLRVFRDIMVEAKALGFDELQRRQVELGTKMRKLLKDSGFTSVAALGFEAPSVIVSYTNDQSLQNGRKFSENGLQIAAGVPLQCNERKDFQTFRVGLFGLEKLMNVERTVSSFKAVLDKIKA